MRDQAISSPAAGSAKSPKTRTGALVLASDPQHRMRGPRRAQRRDAAVGRAGRVEGVRVEGAERAEAGQRLVALEHLRVEVLAVRRARVRRAEHRLAQVAIVACPSRARPGTELARGRPGERLLGCRSRCTGCRARTAGSRSPRTICRSFTGGGVGDLGREAQLAAEHVIVVVEDRDVAIAEGAVRLEALARLVEGGEVVRRRAQALGDVGRGSGGRRRCRGRR